MQRIYKGSLTLLLILIVLKGYAQNYTNSPYSRFGVGDLIDNGFEQNRAMGGTSTALRTPNLINYLNPASYTSQDTMSFIFDIGVSGKSNELESNAAKKQTKNFNFNHIIIGFPLTHWWKTSVGIVPYSRVGFDFLEEGTLSGSYNDYNINYTGNGGINEFYIGNAIEIAHHLSIGINASYLFGELNQSRTVTVTTDPQAAVVEYQDKIFAHDFHFRFGLQYYNTIKENHKLQLGVTFDNKTALNARHDNILIRQAPYITDTLNNINISDKINIPERMALGIAYGYKNNLIVAVDYITQDWTKGSIFGKNDFLTAYNSVRFGTEFTPVSIKQKTHASYWKYFHYRLGAYYSNTYVKIQDQQINDYGISFGIGIPWRNSSKLFSNTSFNIAYQYGVRGTLNNGLIKEKYHIVSFGLTLYDFWFVKRKYD